MKRLLLIIALVVALGLLVFFALGGLAQMGPGMMGPGYYGYGMGPGMMGWEGYGGQQYCPYCGSYLGPGGGYGMGPGMMGPGYYGRGPGMMGPGYYGPGPQYQQLEKPLEKKDAKEMLENYVQSLHNSDLKLGEIKDKDTSFEAEILGKNKALVDTILVDKNTGLMRSAMGGPGRGYRGYGMGPGMMGGRYQGGYGPQYGAPPGPQYQGPSKPLTEKEVRAMVENYVQSTRNPNLKVGKITAKDTYFEAEILTKNDALVDTILVDKNTGWMRSIY
jgi:hypothetical protein